MQRTILKTLMQWYRSYDRKPLIIRGARQVGKTWLARTLAKQAQLQLVELNFERDPQLASLFDSNDPKQTIRHIEMALNITIDAKRSLLFLDEIQTVPALLSKLRWFAEELPALPIVAAGSLLEFALGDQIFSMPVGRIAYLYVEPLSFIEFLLADGKQTLAKLIPSFLLSDTLPTLVHEQLMQAFNLYLLIGGLPAAVKTWQQTHDINQVSQIHHNLLSTYRDDFHKYTKHLNTDYLDSVLAKIPTMLGGKFVYQRILPDEDTRPIKRARELLTRARLCHTVYLSDANGIPLGAQKKDKNHKVILLDVGLSIALLGLNLSAFQLEKTHHLINQGGLCEQVTGQMLRTLAPSYVDPTLYYWIREKKGASAEIDYVVQHNCSIVPIEVKSGKTGTLKSLHLFMHLKKLKYAIRINADLPSITPVNTRLHNGDTVTYTLLSLPFYMVSEIHRLLDLLEDSAKVF